MYHSLHVSAVMGEGSLKDHFHLWFKLLLPPWLQVYPLSKLLHDFQIIYYDEGLVNGGLDAVDVWEADDFSEELHLNAVNFSLL